MIKCVCVCACECVVCGCGYTHTHTRWQSSDSLHVKKLSFRKSWQLPVLCFDFHQCGFSCIFIWIFNKDTILNVSHFQPLISCVHASFFTEEEEEEDCFLVLNVLTDSVGLQGLFDTSVSFTQSHKGRLFDLIFTHRIYLQAFTRWKAFVENTDSSVFSGCSLPVYHFPVLITVGLDLLWMPSALRKGIEKHNCSGILNLHQHQNRNWNQQQPHRWVEIVTHIVWICGFTGNKQFITLCHVLMLAVHRCGTKRMKY